MIDLAELERRAEAATPGPWFQDPKAEYPGTVRLGNHSPVFEAWIGSGLNHTDNAAFIAACDPQTVLALLRVVRASKALIETGLRGTFGHDGRPILEVINKKDKSDPHWELCEALEPFQGGSQ